MLHVKNLSVMHRLSRLMGAAIGMALIGYGAIGHTLWWPLGITLLALALTGLIGWCPMCALYNASKDHA